MKHDSSTAAVPCVRQRVPWLALLGILLVLMMTLGNAAANLVSPKLPSARQRQRAEQTAMIHARRLRITMLLAEGDRCRRYIAHELARALVYDGRSAIPYADDFERRCGEDLVVRSWAIASAKLRLPEVAAR
jgi:hypothetical protein